jgi:hypothetical protein
MSAEEIGQDSDPPVERKQCEQCHHRKLLTEFHRRKNKTDNRMRICAQCYCENLEETRRRGEELVRLRELEHQQREREEQEESAAHQQRQRERVARWPEKACIDCNQRFPINEHGHLVVPFFDMHSSTCERCGASLIITYEEDGRLSYHCPNSEGAKQFQALLKKPGKAASGKTELPQRSVSDPPHAVSTEQEAESGASRSPMPQVAPKPTKLRVGQRAPERDPVGETSAPSVRKANGCSFTEVIEVTLSQMEEAGVSCFECPTCLATRDIQPRGDRVKFPWHPKRTTTTPNRGLRWVKREIAWRLSE